MRKVINGKVYDTETAERVHEVSFGYASDFNHFEEALYRTPNGRWFIVGSGGALTRYATSHSDGTRSGGSAVIVLSDEEALRYLEQNDADAETIERFFQVEEA